MASFSVSITAAGRYSASLSGTFLGGDPVYRNYRRLYLFLTDGRSSGYLTFYSHEAAGGDNTFSGSIDGLTSGTGYQWSVVLQYYDAAGWHDSSYTASGSFATDPEPVPEVQTWIYRNGWRRVQPWICRNGWKKAKPWLYQNEEWK